ncbi:hypothetical protein B0T16DRAFT_421214 [Cercophora newfieldiana]|uniref:Kelch repeat protein n=1 Tax=Cercophora newfieldiana TaxID=92897 RepID=A0AA40CI74_9PEZI|nr:hypothetical protein B0T16DRAFT_421214 [Cercophora newfieldiana]
MVFTQITVTAFVLLALGQSAQALSDVPLPSKFVRRSVAKAAVLGNYVYVDGGEISQFGDDGKIGPRTSNQVNSTLSIDISQSWKTDSVTIRTIPKAPLPPKQNVHLWTDTVEGALYSWGGKFFLGQNMTKTELYKFTADGKGGGSWAVQSPGNPSLFNGLIPGEFSAVTTVNDTGYLIGGIASGWTQLSRARNQVLPGMLAYNMKTHIWQNGTVGFSPFNTLIGAEASYLPTFGPNGLVLVLGGYSPRVDGEPNINASPSQDFRNLTFFNPLTKTTYWQTTTGEAPPSPRGRFCITGFRNTAGGYELFLFGGVNLRDKFTYHDAYILSLPGFVWTKLSEPPAGPRAEQTCVAVGKRQVLSIGGTNPYLAQWTDPDPAPNGLLVFDMTAMAWRDSYDANAAAYEAPDAVQSWYSKGSLDSVEWSSEDVKRLFAVVNEPGDFDPAPNQPSAGEKEGASTPVGAIAGGVVGGVAALVIVLAIVWYVRRRNNKKQQPEHGIPPPELPNTQPSTELKYAYGGPPTGEAGIPDHHELAGGAAVDSKAASYTASNQHELETSHARQELPGWNSGAAPVELYGGEVPRR